MRRLAAYTIFALLLTIAVGATAWTIPDCEAVNYDHPDCDHSPTTTVNDPCDEYHETRHPECQTTTTGQVTTTTSETTTTTPNETTTTQVQETTTTTAAPCAPGLIHQPPLCVPPTTPTTPVVPSTLATTPAGEETLPFTGTNYGMLAVSALGLLVIGGAMVRKAQA